MLRLTYTRNFFLLLLIFFSNSSFAQNTNGWVHVAENDFVTAKAIFEKALLENPNDEDAISGMIFISEIFQDHIKYKKYTNQLIESSWKDEYFALFKHLYQGTPDQILNQSLDPSLLIKPILAKADSLFYYRKFNESHEILERVSSNLEWSVIGPFTNVSGSGHIEKNILESEIFKSTKTYTNENGLKLNWVSRYHNKPSGEVYFNENLPYMKHGTYYANTFFYISNEKTIQLRVARNTPIKIWLDDDLVFENDNNIKFTWDAEVISLKVKKGKHRLLVKSSTYVEQASRSALYLGFNDQNDEEDILVEFLDPEENPFNKRKYSAKGTRTAGFAIRIADGKGNLLSDMTSEFYGKNKTESYQPKIAQEKWINHFQSKIKKDKSDFKNYYFLCKSFLILGLNEEGEAWFFKHFSENKESFAYKYLLSKFYAINDKADKAETLLMDSNIKKTPVAALLVDRLQKINLKNEESDYVQKVLQLLNLTPTHWEGLAGYLNWLNKRGMTDEKEKFINVFLSDYPDVDYEDRLKPYMKNGSRHPNTFVEMTESQRDREALIALQRMKKVFDIYDYLNAIDYYKRKNDVKKVVRSYDDLINFFPHRAYYWREKANFLFDQKEYSDAIATFNKALEIQPYHARNIEKLGDIYLEKEEELKALDFFKKAKRIDKATQKGNYALSRINEKIQQIESTDNKKKYFQRLDYENILADESWKGKYKDSESVILLYNIQANLTDDNQLEYHQNLTIKILNQAGANYWTEADFSFLGDIAKVKIIKSDGAEITPSRNWNLVVFQNLQPGDVILIEGNSKGNMTREIPDEMFHIAWLSMEVPIYRSLFELITPVDKSINYSCNRVDCNAQIREEEDAKIYTFDHYQVEKNFYEEAVLDKMDSFAWIMLSTSNDWSKVVKWYQRKTYQRQKANYQVKSVLSEIITEKMSDEEKVEAVYNYLTSEITYSHVSFLNSSYVPKYPSNTLSSKIGDCKDVSSVMIGMLNELNIPAYYVLVRTSDYTNEEPRPSVLVFNHVIVGYQLSDGLMRYVDLTTDYFSKNELPSFDANQWALIVRERENDIFRLPNDQLNPTKSLLKFETHAKISEQRNLEMQVVMSANGVVAGKLREEINNISTKEDRQKFVEDQLTKTDFDQITIKNLQFENLPDMGETLVNKLNLKAYNHLEKVSKFQIMQIPLLNPITTQPAMFSESRKNNLDLTKLFEVAPTEQVVELEIPSGYELLEIPEPIFIHNEFGSYELTFSEINKGIKVNRKLLFKSSSVAFQDYQRFKKFYLEMLDADRTKLAIRKRAVVVSQKEE